MDVLMLFILVPVIAVGVALLVLGALYMAAPELLLAFIGSFTPKKKIQEHFIQKEEAYDDQVIQPQYPPQQDEPPRRRRYG